VNDASGRAKIASGAIPVPLWLWLEQIDNEPNANL